MKTLKMLSAGFALLLAACAGKKENKILLVGTAADNPPFEYRRGGNLAGFDIELATLVGEKMGREVYFQERPFNSLLPDLQRSQFDMVAAGMSITDERKKDVDFSDAYFEEDWVVVCPKQQPLTSVATLAEKKIGCQLGSTIESWVRQSVPRAEIVVMENNQRLLEALKAGRLDGLVVGKQTAEVICRQNQKLTWHLLGEADDAGYGFALRKKSSLTSKVNDALKRLDESGQLGHLKAKWMGTQASSGA